MRIFKYLLASVLVALLLLAVTTSAYVWYADSPCGMSRAAKHRILKNLSPADAATLRSSKSISEPVCPDVFSYRQESRLIQVSSWDVVEKGLPRSPRREEPICRFEGLHLPKRYQIIAAFAPAGRKNFSLVDPDYNMPSSEVDVVVDTRVPVVLMLIGYIPTVWNIKPAKQTHLLAVFVNGTHRQWVLGADPHLPKFISTRDDGGSCGWLFESGAQEDVDGTAQHLFGRPTDHTYRPGAFNSDVVRIFDGG